MNLIEGLHSEMNRVRELIQVYDSVPNGIFAATLMRQAVTKAEQAVAEGDTVQMMLSYTELEGFTE